MPLVTSVVVGGNQIKKLSCSKYGIPRLSESLKSPGQGQRHRLRRQVSFCAMDLVSAAPPGSQIVELYGLALLLKLLTLTHFVEPGHS
jgi:hypothetical protein